ncbi:AbrB/MazE/SpoVT family DNA-binding domain-containing protein [Candidatus Woesearchaeota archaeon]|nr:AbrB/MazE/SpoVT family DNA-binding domain-containing protein [Candidatus Woesearchaeota archaeon]
MSKCFCGGKRIKLKGKTPEGIEYEYFRCAKCGEEILGINEIHEISQKYKKIKQYSAKITKWGLSLGLRIPAELVKKYNLKNKEELIIIPEEGGFRVVK